MATKTYKIGLSDTDKQNMAQDIYERVINLEFNEYDSSKTYNAGDYVIYNDTLYVCTATTTGTFDSNDWSETTVDSVIHDNIFGSQNVNDTIMANATNVNSTADLDNLNNAIVNRIYMFSTNSIPNQPIAEIGILKTSGLYQGYSYQEYVTFYNHKKFYRIQLNGVWSQWYDDAPTQHKDLQFSSYPTSPYNDFDTVPSDTTVVYTTDLTNIANKPENSQGTLYSFGFLTNVFFQVYVTSSGNFYFRRKWNTWSDWQKTVNQNDVNETYKIIGDRLSPTYTNNKFITGGSTIANVDGFCYSAPFYAEKGDVLYIKARGYLTNVSILSKTNESETTREIAILSDGSIYHWYRYNVEEDGYFQVSGNMDSEIIIIDQKKVLNQKYPTTTTGYYIDNYGTVASNSDFYYTAPFYVKKGTRLRIKARGYLNYVSILSKTDSSSSYHTPAVICDDSTYKWYEYNVYEDGYYSTCGNIDSAIIIEYEYIETKDISSTIGIFEKIAVIGDSFASGQVWLDSSTGITKYYLSWIQNIARRNGITAQNYSQGGLTTRSWLTESNGLAKMNNSPADNLYILALGINDAWALGDDYLGSISDINDSDPTQNADTFYGNYGKIIEAIKTHAPNCKLIISTLADNSTTTKQNYNNAIVEIANHYGIPCIYQYKDYYFQSPRYLDTMVAGHPTAVGYGEMAKALERLIDECLSSNRPYFNDYVGN